MSDRLIVAGCGDALGVPRVYCDCFVCQHARADVRHRRTRSSSVLVSGDRRLCIDVGPDWRAQMTALGLLRLDTALLTHTHHDHVGGLPELYDAARWTGEAPEVLMPSQVKSAVLERFPWIERAIHLHAMDGPCAWQGWAIRPFSVNHGHNGRSFAYRFDRPSFSFAYCPDAVDLSADEKRWLSGLDLLVLGTSFYDEAAPLARRSVYSVVEALSLLEELIIPRSVLTHLSHDLDVQRDYGLPSGVVLGQDGLVVPLS